MKTRAGLAALCLAFALPSTAIAQSYRVRVDARTQSVWFRGLTADSILAAEAVTTAEGGFTAPDGRAVRCGAGLYCFFFRPGPELHAMPVSATVGVTAWGLGTEGLSLRATGRLIGDLGGDDVWPAAEPAAQLIEGLLEYRRGWVVARAGRQLIASRLEAIGFDGGWLKYGWNRVSLEVAGYAGWGLGQAAAVSPSNPALNPLDEFRPRDRQIVAGVEAGWSPGALDVRGEYRREIDPEDDYFVSERAALSLATRWRALDVNGGLDYNIAEGHLGNADVRLSLLRNRYSVTAGARRYKPYFSLWTLWGAFSPVPYTAFNVSAETRFTKSLSIHTRVERFQYSEAEVSTALVPQLEDRGWRFRLGGNAALGSRLTADGNFEVETGPGASTRSGNVAIGYRMGERLALDAFLGALSRPLELRYYDAESRWIGVRAQFQQSDTRRAWADAALVSDERNRPDAGASSLDQVRIRAGLTISLGNSADRLPLPPARPARR